MNWEKVIESLRYVSNASADLSQKLKEKAGESNLTLMLDIESAVSGGLADAFYAGLEEDPDPENGKMILIDDPRHVPDFPGGKLVIWTDGSCSPNPGPGGWGLYAEADGNPWVSLNGPGGKNTTNNQMELKAAIEALKIIPPKTHAIIYTDSQYVKRGITEWISGWIRQGWKTSSKKPVKNKDLWVELSDLATNPNVEWQWVKAHNGNPGNEKADELAGKGRAMNEMFP